MQSPIQTYLAEVHGRLSDMRQGQLASYIPELTKADPNWFGICLVTLDGVAYSVGDTEQTFTIQSISKPFVFATALADRGQQVVARKVGVEPSGDAFNSISLDPKTGAPLNPMINAGAIATTSLVAGDTTEAQWRRIEASIAAFIGAEARTDEAVYRSESETGFRNRAIAWMLKNFGIIDGEPMAVLENYFRQCSLLVNCRDLAFMAATLANGGVQPVTGASVLPAEHVERVLSVLRHHALPRADFSQPAQVLQGLNAMFDMDEHAGMYFTIWYGIYDAQRRTLRYASGGHHPAFLVPPGRGEAMPLHTRNVAIGTTPEYPFKSEEIQVPSGSALYLFSDGVFEIVTAAGAEWRLQEFVPMILQPPSAELSEPERLLAAVRQEARRDAFDDDFAMLVATFP